MTGWRHGPLPDPPEGLLQSSRALWIEWFTSWRAAYWTEIDTHTLRLVIKLHDHVARGHREMAAELRRWEDMMGITPKGQRDLGWKPRPHAVDE